ncbi:hypothetical protein HK405_005577 [Cladochytrium tenue]|nr:hypothetical protein HK405_005577 [Cladochytrium tenue]
MSASLPVAATPDSTVVLNVGGTRLESAAFRRALLLRFPDSLLARALRDAVPSSTATAPFATQLQQPPELFVDENPAAFAVVVDYVRHGRVFCPADVSEDLVWFLIDKYGLSNAQALSVPPPPPPSSSLDKAPHTTTDWSSTSTAIPTFSSTSFSSTPSWLPEKRREYLPSLSPPPYFPPSSSSSSFPSSSNVLADIKSPAAQHAVRTHALLTHLAAARIAPLLTPLARVGHRRAVVVISDRPDLARDDASGALAAFGPLRKEDLGGLPRVFVAVADARAAEDAAPDGEIPLSALLEDDGVVGRRLADLVVEAARVAACDPRRAELTVRVVSEFGLVDTVKVDALLLVVSIL